MGPKVHTHFFWPSLFLFGVKQKIAAFTRFAFHFGAFFLTTNLILLELSSVYTCYY